ncbi:MAG: hypothetical protein ACO4CT_03385 [Planctomycetota bacterium]|jgi:hypothetical protein
MSSSSAAQYRRLLEFYSAEVTRYARVWLDANPGQIAIGFVFAADAPRPAGFVGIESDGIARGVASRAAAEDYLQKHAPGALAHLPGAGSPPAAGVLALGLFDEAVVGLRLALP